MNRSSWSSQQQGRIQLGNEAIPNGPKKKTPSVPKAALEEGILQLLASAAEMQQRQDLDSAHQLYQAAMEKVKDHGLNRKNLFTGTAKKPPPLNRRTPIEWCLHVGDIASAICLLEGPNAALAKLRTEVNLQRVEEILDAGADIEYRIGPVGRTFLLQAAVEDRHAAVRLALDRGASVDCMDDNGDTALALVLRCSQPQSNAIVADLLDAQADISLCDGMRRPLFKVALEYAQPEAVTQIVEALSPLTAENRQCMQDWAASSLLDGHQWSNRTIDVVRLLLTKGLDPDTRSQLSGGELTLLGMAMQRNAASSHGLIAELLEKGAEPILETALRSATSPALEQILTKLMPLTETHYQQIAAWLNTIPSPKKWRERDVEVLQVLLDYGLSPNTRRAEAPRSPLIVCAASCGNINLVQRLIARGAKLTVADDNSDTAIMVAAKRRNREIYDALKSAGVDDSMFWGWSVWSKYSNG